MTGKAGVDQRQAATTTAGRVYRWKGDSYWSVTTLLKGLPAPQIAEWGKTKVAEAAVGNWQRIGDMLRGTKLQRVDTRIGYPVARQIRRLFGLREGTGPIGTEDGDDPLYIVRSDPDAVLRAIRYLRDAPYAEQKRKGELGTAIHAEIEAYINGTPRPEPPAEVALPLAQFRLFLEAVRPRFVVAEANVYNASMHYAGRLDALAYVGAEGVAEADWHLYVLDWTSAARVYPEKAYQCAAYARAEFIGLPDGTEITMPRVDGAAILRLDEDSWELVPAEIGDDVFDDFLYIAEVFRIHEVRSKRVLGVPVRSADALYWLSVGQQPRLELLPGGPPGGVMVELHPEDDDL